MKKVLIIPEVTDRNRGDQTLVWESARLAESIYGEKTEITLINSKPHDEISQTKALKYGMLTPILKHPSRIYKNKNVNYNLLILFLWGVCGLFDLIRTSFLLSKFKHINRLGYHLFNKSEQKTIDYYKECDSIFVKGGGFLHSYGGVTDAYLFYFYMFGIKLAIRYGKPIVLLPNSIGPLKNKLAKKMLEKTLNKCSLVYTRESVSQKFVESNTTINSRLSLDLAFYQESSKTDFSDYLKTKGIDINNKNILITLRPYRFPGCDNPIQKYQEYIISIRDFIKVVRGYGYYVTLFAHTLGPSKHENDADAIKDVLNLCESTEGVVYIEDKDLTCRDVQKIYSYYNCVVGTRFHSVIFALNSLVPTIAITYGGNKGIGIMKDLGLSDYSIPIEEVSVYNLSEKFNSLINNKPNFINNVIKLLEKAKNERKLIINQIKNIKQNIN